VRCVEFFTSFSWGIMVSCLSWFLLIGCFDVSVHGVHRFIVSFGRGCACVGVGVSSVLSVVFPLVSGWL
jgi:hypothetical protein